MELKCYNSCHFRTTGYSFNRTAYGIEIKDGERCFTNGGSF